jgi:hypothetical protein
MEKYGFISDDVYDSFSSLPLGLDFHKDILKADWRPISGNTCGITMGAG